ncbi:LLM class flavin-dependent oxidoreductase [Phytohabitans flavus]|uniref:Luciferase n=1 Tax=Phytohabitans flavus TaxID=1076124 RepID=A0A6F8XX62_9ACTN|nr:LLM class flavin-dependent oxidoreductase [Phytohabitans flavus]BCB78400.1 luciferase [Phytohabitans flavus]
MTTALRAGIVILADQRWATAAGRWRRAEQYGFAHAWTYDHIGWRDLVDGPWFDAVPTLAAAAGVTSHIRLGTMVASPNFRHPVHFAREVTALDDISGGRLTLGVGAGGVAGFDNAVLGGEALPPRARVDRFTEFLEILDPLLRDEAVTYRGRYYTAVDARGTPGSFQSPRVPLVVAGLGPRSMRLAARYGAGWVTTVGRMDSLDAWWRAARESMSRFAEVLAAAGRELSTVDRYLSLDAAPRFSLSSAAYYAEALGRAAEYGFTDVLSHWPRADSWYAGDEAVLDEVAETVLPTLKG